MLSKKLVKAGLLSVTLFSVIAVVNANDAQQPADSTQATTDTTQWFSFDSAQLKLTGATTPDMPVIKLNKQAMAFAKDYLAKNGLMLGKIKEQHPTYFSIMDSVLTREGVPTELKYLAIVESRLKVNSVSHAGAAGAWQLMPVAARMYSLKVNGKYDERKHFYKSTEAAAKLLSDLHDRFGDWLLVIAAYNSGPGGVYKAIKKSGSRNYWKLQQFLPTETRNHVRRFISTHYYFEEQGSIATLTKDEIPAYTKMMSEYAEKQNQLLKEKLAAIAPPLDVTTGITEATAVAGDIKENEKK
jgi:membrane-bound lytic murein transglycosylase D